MAQDQTPQTPDGKGRPVLTAENYQKVLRVAQVLGLSSSDVVNMIISKISEIEINQVLTFRVEVKEPGKEKVPGVTRYVTKSSNFSTNF